MPVITLGSGNYIQDAKSGIITYWQRIDMPKIAKILATGRFEDKVEVVIDNDKLDLLLVAAHCVWLSCASSPFSRPS